MNFQVLNQTQTLEFSLVFNARHLLGVAPYMVFHISTTIVGPYVCWRIRVNVEEVAYEWHLGYLGAIGL
jgi:hypothetical protein